MRKCEFIEIVTVDTCIVDYLVGDQNISSLSQKHKIIHLAKYLF